LLEQLNIVHTPPPLAPDVRPGMERISVPASRVWACPVLFFDSIKIIPA
jgi:hypothetical protein